MNPLKSVPTAQPEPPYPADTKVRGWRFQLDHERIGQSDTWALASPEMRPWLLMLWMTAWQQTPVGSFSSDHRIIAAKIGMDYRQFSAHADILLRGWVLHSDDRLYHPVLVEQMLERLAYRAAEADRKAKYREKMSQRSPAGHDGDGRGSDDTGAGAGAGAGASSSVLAVSDDTARRQTDDKSPNVDACPHKKIIDLYHQHCPRMPVVRTWKGQRPIHLRARWKEHPTLAWWEGFLQYAGESAFLNGRVNSFVASLDWMIKPENFQKIAEGKYHR